jgi:hypothetical protein
LYAQEARATALRRLERFAEVWAEAYALNETVDYVADKLGMPRPIAQSRASEYRGRGLRLKDLRRRNSEDIDKLNQLMEEIGENDRLQRTSSLKSSGWTIA